MIINTLIFDLGGVVVFETPNLLKTIFTDMSKETGISYETFDEGLKKYKTDVQTGKMTLLDFYKNNLSSSQKTDIKPEQLLQMHLSIYEKYSGEYDNEMLELIKKLRNNYNTVCLTNTEPEIAELNRKKGLFNYFNRSFISTEMGLRKPDTAVYEKVLDELQIEPQQAVFIDNISSYVEAAEKTGMSGIVYSGIERLKQDLKMLDVDID
jgi:putative hydrolase of the HAD superfamily